MAEIKPWKSQHWGGLCPKIPHVQCILGPSESIFGSLGATYCYYISNKLPETFSFVCRHASKRHAFHLSDFFFFLGGGGGVT
jgi:hypothetical protein